VTPSETEAQNAINAAGAASSAEYLRRLKAMPRWRQWLVGKLAPRWPFTVAQAPPGVIELTKPLDVPPGVILTGTVADSAEMAAYQEASNELHYLTGD
jgi:hypothetical protein